VIVYNNTKLTERVTSSLPIEWPIIANGRHHDDFIRRQFPNFIDERLVHKIWSTNAQIQNGDFPEDGVIESIQEPRCVANLIKSIKMEPK
jgi:hypothetical protein